MQKRSRRMAGRYTRRKQEDERERGSGRKAGRAHKGSKEGRKGERVRKEGGQAGTKEERKEGRRKELELR